MLTTDGAQLRTAGVPTRNQIMEYADANSSDENSIADLLRLIFAVP